MEHRFAESTNDILADAEYTLAARVFAGLLESDDRWGPLHIAIEDDNLEDAHVQWCLDEANRQKDERAVMLATRMLRITYGERCAAVLIFDGLEAHI